MNKMERTFGVILNIWNKTNRWYRAFGILALFQLGLIPQRTAGFYCNDFKLSHPYTGDTISWKLLLFMSIVLPLFMMFFVEANIRKRTNETLYQISKRSLWLRWYGEYSFGLLMNIILVQIIKVSVGEPRPHFFDVCKPDTQCEGSEFVSSYRCTKTIYSESRMADSARSFPSGHTSIALHTGVFLTWYLHKRSKQFCNSSYYVIPITQVFLILTATYCGLSRITDHRHHWWDVLAGLLLGICILIYTVRYLCNNFDCLDVAVATTTASHSNTSVGALPPETNIHQFVEQSDGLSKLVPTHTSIVPH